MSSRVFSHIKYTSQSTQSMQRTEQRLRSTQDCALPTQESDDGYLIHTFPPTFVCIMTVVGNIPNSANVLFAYLLNQADPIISSMVPNQGNSFVGVHTNNFP